MSATAFQRRRRELEAQLAEEQQQNQGDDAIEQNPVNDVDKEDVEQTAGYTPEEVEEMTKAQIIAALEKLKIEFNNRDNKEVLKGLLLDADK